jgi:myo-inositol-1(or 4)-monophosphatase
MSSDREDLVTNGDLQSNQLIIKRLKSLTPDVNIFSEEDEKEMTETNKPCWIVDPIDGTYNYFHQLQEWGVSIALAINGRTKIAGVYLPAIGRLKVLIESGVQFFDASLRVREDTDISHAQIWTDHIKGPAEPVIDIFTKLTKHTTCPQIRLCATYSLLNVAYGNITGYVHPAPKPEDIAAAALIVEKAGGKVTDIQGNPWTPFSKSIVATNGLLHDQLLSVLNS